MKVVRVCAKNLKYDAFKEHENMLVVVQLKGALIEIAESSTSESLIPLTDSERNTKSALIRR